MELEASHGAPAELERTGTDVFVGLRMSRVMAELSGPELHSMLAHLFAVLPQRGCAQVCLGCHASALNPPSTALWPTLKDVLAVMDEAARAAATPVQSAYPAERRLIESLRDGDPSHYSFRDPTVQPSALRGVGDYAEAVKNNLQAPIKIMTAGLWRMQGKPQLVNLAGGRQALDYLAAEDADQLRKAAMFSGRLSVSISKQTIQYRKLGMDADAKLLAETFMTLHDGAPPDVPVYLDIMFFSRDGQDPDTQETVALLGKTLDCVDERYLTRREKEHLMQTVRDYRHGEAFIPWLVEGKNIGVRSAPYLVTGRAAKEGRGLRMDEGSLGSILTVLDGNDDDKIALTVGGTRHEWSRRDLRGFEAVHDLATLVLTARGHGFLAEEARIEGNWFDFFRSELDLTPAREVSELLLKNAPGVNLPPGFNLLVTDVLGGDLQVIVPFKRLILPDCYC